jgi:hypothetical protein
MTYKHWFESINVRANKSTKDPMKVDALAHQGHIKMSVVHWSIVMIGPNDTLKLSFTFTLSHFMFMGGS